MHASLLALALLVAPVARADDPPVEVRPTTIRPLKLHWYEVDGVPQRYGAIEGWLLTDPASRPHTIRHHQMKFFGASFLAAGTSALVVGLGFALRDLNAPAESGSSSTFYDWIPAIGGAALIVTGIPLLVVSDKHERKAVELYTGVAPKRDGAAVTVTGQF